MMMVVVGLHDDDSEVPVVAPHPFVASRMKEWLVVRSNDVSLALVNTHIIDG